MDAKTCGTCRRFVRLRDGGLVGTCGAGPLKRGGVPPTVSASMGAGDCPDYGEMDGRAVAARERSDRIMGTLDRLSDALFDELDRLGGLDLKDADAVDAELSRAKTICGVASAITANNNTAMAAVRMQAELGVGKASMPKMLEVGDV